MVATEPFRGVAHAAQTIYAQDGLWGFARGVSGRVLWVAPSTMIMFTAYDNIVKRLPSSSAAAAEPAAAEQQAGGAAGAGAMGKRPAVS